MMTPETLAPEELMELDSIINAIHALNQHDNPTRYAKRKVSNWYNLFSDPIFKKLFKAN